MISLKHVDRSYKTRAGPVWVLRGIDLEIREREFITIMGPSGAGKSSLLNVLALLDDQWQGEYWLRDQAVLFRDARDRTVSRPILCDQTGRHRGVPIGCNRELRVLAKPFCK